MTNWPVKMGNTDVIVNGDNWHNVTYDDRYKFMAFYEQLALMVQSDLITEDIAFYVFGYELIQAVFGSDLLQSVFGSGLLQGRYNPNFWNNNDPPDHRYWQLFIKFADQMLSYQNRYKPQLKFPVETYKF